MNRKFERLNELGADTAEGIARVIDNEELYVTCLKKFSQQSRENNFQQLLEEKRYEVLGDKTHTFKGTSGNLSLQPLYERYTKIVSDIRENNYDNLKDELDDVLRLQAEFDKAIDAL